MSNLRERVMLDRYATKDISGPAKTGDLVIVSVWKKTEKDVEPREYREIGTIRAIGNLVGAATVFTIDLMTENESKETITAKRNEFEVLQEKSWFEICDRVVTGAEEAEPDNKSYITDLRNFLYEEAIVAAGRINAGYGRRDGKDLTFFNCFVKQILEDSRQGISAHFASIFEIFSRGGGCGWALDILRPKGSEVRGVNGKSSGVCSWATHFANITETVIQGGSRRGASLQALSAWHPDIKEFVSFKNKRRPVECPHCKKDFEEQMKVWEASNVSMFGYEAFMEAVKADSTWDLEFPDTSHKAYNKEWDGDLYGWKAKGYPTIVYETVQAKELFDFIVDNAWKTGDPGFLFIDRINASSNSYYYTRLVCTNPCGEEPLPPNGICNLTHINLSKFILPDTSQFPSAERPGREALLHVDFDKLSRAINVAVRFLDNIIDANKYQDEETEKLAKAERRVGLGILGLAELMIRLGIRYGSTESLEFIDGLMDFFKTQSYLASVELAKEKGPFPLFDAEKFLESGFCRTLSADLRNAIKTNGIRNVTLNTIAPTGSVGTMVGTSTGGEPYIGLHWKAKSRIGLTQESINIWDELKEVYGDDPKKWPKYVVTSNTVSPIEHVQVQAELQKHVDSSISKTVNLPNSATREDIAEIFMAAYDLGCKGITIYRDGSKTEQVLYVEDEQLSLPEVKNDLTVDNVTVQIISRELSGILRPKIKKGLSHTDSRETPVGNLHSTLRFHPVTGEPYDFFCESGGGDIGADTEAIARLISTILRWPDKVEVPQVVRIQIIQDQLLGIRGRGQTGFGPEAIFSLPDGVAKFFKEYIQGEVPLAGLPTGKEKVKDFVRKIRSCKSEQDLERFIDTGIIDPSKCGCTEEDCAHAQDFAEAEMTRKAHKLEYCPQCGNATLVTDGGCAYCIDQQCNYSAC